MNDNAKAWVAALRSGEFAQTGGSLRDKDGYCCLGVACELHRRATGGEWLGSGEYCGAPENEVRMSYLQFRTALPPVVRTWLGLATMTGMYIRLDGSFHSLSRDNDFELDFATIANTIEREPKGLFTEGG